MKIKIPLTAALISSLLLAPSQGALSDSKKLAVLPASGVWLRTPKIPWPDWQPGHRGLDIAAPADTEVFAPIDGNVVWVGRIGKNFGITIKASAQIKHTITGLESPLAIGDKVSRGQFIGWSIISQHCENLDCIHWSVKQNGRYLDPRWLLKPIVYRLPTPLGGLVHTHF